MAIDHFTRAWYSIHTLPMTPEILAKIMGIIAKTGERVVVIDPRSGTPFCLMNLDEYEKMANRAPVAPVLPPPQKDVQSLTQNKGEGIIDPELALLKGVGIRPTEGWGGDESEEDRYYMEPAD